MAIKDIVLHYGSDSRRGARFEACVGLARRFGARLVGVHALTLPHVAGYMQMDISPALIEQQMADAQARAAELRRELEAAAGRQGVAVEWLTIEGGAARAMALAARHADLAVVGQANPDEPRLDDRLPDELVLSAGRPVLVWPYAGDFHDPGKRVMVAWNDTREAARALHDAMDFLVAAEQVTVCTVNAPGRERIPGADIAAHLARHGVKADVHPVTAPDLAVGDALLAAVSDFGIDLVTMGGYGHSRLRELALGGATRHLLAHMTVPVLMSH